MRSFTRRLPCVELRKHDPLSEELLRGAFTDSDTIVVDVVWDKDHEKIIRLNFQGVVREEPAVEAVASKAEETGEKDSKSK